MKKTIRIEGMSCNHCKSSVEKALSAVSGVSKAEVDLAAKTAAVEADGAVADEALKKAVTDAGFEVIDIK